MTTAWTIAWLAAATLVLAQGAGWRASPDVVARTASQEKRNINYEEARVPPYTLPDVLGAAHPRTTAAEWKPRRDEVLDLFRTNVYGRSPGGVWKK